MHSFNNYLKISLRKLYREKLYALINIAGLALAIACCAILALYLRSELTYDRHHEKHERIFRVANDFINQGQEDSFAVSSPVIGPMLARDFNEVEEYVRLRRNPPLMIRHQDQAYFWDTVYFADPSIFDVFTHEIIYGDTEGVLEDPSTVAVSESFARRYFGNENPIGKIISSERGGALSIAAVFADFPENTHLKYDLLFSSSLAYQNIPDNDLVQRTLLWTVNEYTYLLMREGFDPADFPSMVDAFYQRHMEEIGQANNYFMRIYMQPLADIHLHSEVTMDLPTGNPAYLYAFAVIAAFILGVACINYTNLATARSMRRAREVGMRKILGANKARLMLQFLAEAMLFSLLALAVGLILVEIALELTPLNQLLGKDLSLNLAEEPTLLAWGLALSLGVGLLAGLYPALYLSSWAPLSALVTTQSAGSGNVRLRQGLVLTQFMISIGVVAATVLMAGQMAYLSNKNLGFDKENLIHIPMVGAEVIQKVPVIKQELIKHPGILGVATHARLPGDDLPIGPAPVESDQGVMENHTLIFTQADMDYLKVMGMRIKQGRDFSQRLLTDVGTSVVVNEAMVGRMGWENPLGKRLRDGRVIGVVEDFHFRSLHHPLEPLAILPFNDNWEEINQNPSRVFMRRNMTVKLAGENLRETIAYLEERFAAFDPRHPFEFHFLDDTLDALYQNEQRLMKLTGIFAGICIFIACLGLFGLASFTTEQRNKEIGIRKVLGASTMQIILLLSRSVVALVLIGGLIASVVVWLGIDEWLTGFAYRMELGPLPFAAAVLAALAVAFATVALQSYRTAQANPVEALRHE